jgi:type II secretory pathway pseudopilin PulG
LIAILVILTVAAALTAAAAPQRADAASLKGRLHQARLALRKSQDRLRAAESALAAAVAARSNLATDAVAAPAAAPDPTLTPTLTPTPTPTPAPTPSAAPAARSVTDLKAAVAKARHAVRVWKARVHRLAGRYSLQRRMTSWERQQQWMQIIEVAAAKYHVSAGGMYRMMMRESGGQRFAGSGTAFKGLFQYHIGTWAASWNPWRHDDIYDGSSQIFATAYAIHKGMGPSMWTTTFASQY